MVFKTLLVVLVFVVLLEDTASIRKTEKEEKKDRELAEKVNATLAEEEEKERQEEEGKKKKQLDQEKKQEETGQETGSGTGSTGKKEGQDEACPTFNHTCPDNKPCQACPEVRPCLPCKECPAPVVCQPCEDCPPCKECGPCPIRPCRPCQPCVSNDTVVQPSFNPGCPEPVQAMTVPVAMAVGAGAALLVTGVATVVGLLSGMYLHLLAASSFCPQLSLCGTCPASIRRQLESWEGEPGPLCRRPLWLLAIVSWSLFAIGMIRLVFLVNLIHSTL
jgi:hypothetical protein